MRTWVVLREDEARLHFDEEGLELELAQDDWFIAYGPNVALVASYRHVWRQFQHVWVWLNDQSNRRASQDRH